jgi:hypothetical protein
MNIAARLPGHSDGPFHQSQRASVGGAGRTTAAIRMAELCTAAIWWHSIFSMLLSALIVSA